MQSSSGLIRLQSAPLSTDLCPGRESDCKSAAKGSHEIAFDRLLGRSVPPTATAGVIETGEIVFLLGECCDRGEISAHGRLEHDTIRGRWIETFVSGGRRGTFSASRVRQSRTPPGG
jgi:hypothetical protein